VTEFGERSHLHTTDPSTTNPLQLPHLSSVYRAWLSQMQQAEPRGCLQRLCSPQRLAHLVPEAAMYICGKVCSETARRIASQR
jgi:hypothetical protein